MRFFKVEIAAMAAMMLLISSAAARPVHTSEASAQLLNVTAQGKAGSMQLDPCNSQQSRTPSMVLDVSNGVCTVSSRVLPQAGSGKCSAAATAAADASSGALQLSFPCWASSEPRARLTGPALNLWASLSPAAASSAGAAAGSRSSSVCSVTTLSPSLASKKVPAGYYYGYEVGQLPCQQVSGDKAVEALKLGSKLEASDNTRMGVQYGLWLVPSLPTPSQGTKDGFSTQAQECKLAVTTTGRTYVSDKAYPCALVMDPEAKLGQGCCFGSPAYAAAS